MRIGLLLTAPPDALSQLPVSEIEDAGVWAIFLRCFEDEMRWSAATIASFAQRVRQTSLRLFIVPAGYGLFAPELHPSSLFIRVHPDTRQVDNRGRRIPRACPNNTRYLEWLAASMRMLAWLIEADGFAWEEPGFYFGRGGWACTCRYCRELYSGPAMRQFPDELVPQVLQFRQRCISAFLAAASAAVKSVDRQLASLTMPTPAPQTGAVPTGNENWVGLARTDGVDGIVLTWPPGQYGGAELAAAAGFYTSARSWLAGETTVLLRLVCPQDVREVDLTLKQLDQLGLQAALLEDRAFLASTGVLSARSRELLSCVSSVAR